MESFMAESSKALLSGNEAIARAMRAAGIALGTGYPGTPSTEILENFSALGGPSQWAPNEKVAFEVALGGSFGGARTVVTMKHVGVNVAADPLFTAAYTGVPAALVLISADDPGMASSQNEQDNRRYAVAAGLPMIEPSDSQEAYDFFCQAVTLSEKWRIPVLFRITTRVCHSKTVVDLSARYAPAPGAAPSFVRDIRGHVMIPAYARKAHRELRRKLGVIAVSNETSPMNVVIAGSPKLGIIASGISAMHVREAAPEATMLKLATTYPLPLTLIRRFAESVERCVVIEEGDPYLVESLRAAGISVHGKPEMFRFCELDVNRVRRILAEDTSPEPAPMPGKPPKLCKGCPHTVVFTAFRDLGCIVAGDIGCYTLGALPPLEAMDTCVSMGASIAVGLGLRHVLPAEQARKVVSVIGDSTFAHSGLNGLVEMVYNPPPTGHVVVIVDNGTTAMTGQQEHPGTGRTLDHGATGKLVFEDVARAMGIRNVRVTDPLRETGEFERLLAEALASGELAVIITRRPCLLAAGKIRQYEQKVAAAQEACGVDGE
jgi:indolepyruvate ferredoxin oxidoreductase alpha subunit